NPDPIGQAAIALAVSPASESQHQPGRAGFSESLGWLWTPQMTLTGSLPAVETGSLADTAGPHHGLSPVSREARSNWLVATFDSLKLIGTAPSQRLDANPSELARKAKRMRKGFGSFQEKQRGRIYLSLPRSAPETAIWHAKWARD